MKALITRTQFVQSCVTVLLLLTNTLSYAETTSLEEAEKKIGGLTTRIADSPKNPKLYVSRGDLYFLVHEFDTAVEDYSTAIKLDPSLDSAYYGRGLALGRQGFIKEGIEDLTYFIKKNPESSLAYTKRGVRYLWLSEYDNAKKDFNQALSLDPNNAEAHDDLGVVLAQGGNYVDAIKHFQATIRIEPSYQKGHHNLAMAYYITENDLLALNAVNTSLQLKSTARSSLLLKSKILTELGQLEAAAAIEEEAEFLPEGDWSEQVSIQ